MAKVALTDISRLLSGTLIAKVFGVVALMLFARILTKTQLAIFPAYLMLIGISSLFFSFGIFQTFVRKLPSLIRENEPEARSLVMTGTAIIMAGMLVVAAGGLWWSPAIASLVFHDAGEAWAIRIMVVGFIGAALGKVAENIMWGRGQFAATSLLQILDSVVRPPITIVMYYRFGLQGIVWGLVIAQVANALCSLYCVRDIFIGPLPRLYPVRKLIAESLPFYIDGYLWYLKGDGDTLLVSLLLGPAMLAEYYVAKTLYSNVMLVLTSLDKVALERLARYARLPELFREKAREMQLNISRSMIPLTLLVIAVTPYAMTVLAGPRYSGAKWPAIGLLVAALVQFLVITTDRAVFVALSGTWRLTKTAVEAACALSSALLLVPSLGLMGVIAARIFGPAMGGLFGTVVLNRKLRLSLPFGTAVLSFAVACPGTILILIFAPPLYGGVAALLGMVGSTIVWTAAFSLCTYVVDRDTFLNCMGLLRSRWRI